MKTMRFSSISLVCAAALCVSAVSFAADDASAQAGAASAKAPAAKPVPAKKPLANKGKPVVVHLVDINGASVAELKKLPGIGDAEAKAIVAGRPYGSVNWLVQNKVLPDSKFFPIHKRIEARFPYTDGAKNIAWLKEGMAKRPSNP